MKVAIACWVLAIFFRQGPLPRTAPSPRRRTRRRWLPRRCLRFRRNAAGDRRQRRGSMVGTSPTQPREPVRLRSTQVSTTFPTARVLYAQCGCNGPSAQAGCAGAGDLSGPTSNSSRSPSTCSKPRTVAWRSSLRSRRASFSRRPFLGATFKPPFEEHVFERVRA